MKNIFYSVLLFSFSFLMASCDKQEYDLPELYTYAIVGQELPSPQATGGNDTSAKTYFFKMDDGKTFYVSEQKFVVDYSKLKKDDRVIVGVTLKESANASYDYAAQLYDMIKVTLGSTKTIQDASEDVADHKFYFVNKEISLKNGYLNLFAGYETLKIDNVKFYLVENNQPKENPSAVLDDEYLDLELRYDRGGQEEKGLIYKSYISFNMDEFKDKLIDKKGINLRLKTENSGTISVLIDSDNLYPQENN